MDENIQDFPESPFEPGHPVSPDKFKGRKKTLIKSADIYQKLKTKECHFIFS